MVVAPNNDIAELVLPLVDGLPKDHADKIYANLREAYYRGYTNAYFELGSAFPTIASKLLDTLSMRLEQRGDMQPTDPVGQLRRETFGFIGSTLLRFVRPRIETVKNEGQPLQLMIHMELLGDEKVGLYD